MNVFRLWKFFFLLCFFLIYLIFLNFTSFKQNFIDPINNRTILSLLKTNSSLSKISIPPLLKFNYSLPQISISSRLKLNYSLTKYPNHLYTKGLDALLYCNIKNNTVSRKNCKKL